jgi:hypothetical protein
MHPLRSTRAFAGRDTLVRGPATGTAPEGHVPGLSHRSSPAEQWGQPAVEARQAAWPRAPQLAPFTAPGRPRGVKQRAKAKGQVWETHSQTIRRTTGATSERSASSNAVVLLGSAPRLAPSFTHWRPHAATSRHTTAPKHAACPGNARPPRLAPSFTSTAGNAACRTAARTASDGSAACASEIRALHCRALPCSNTVPCGAGQDHRQEGAEGPGGIPAGNYIRLPRTKLQSLGLAGRFLYSQVSAGLPS